jgi:hypothetical protein
LRDKEVRQKARTVNEVSLNYHLTHAIFACNQLLRDAYKETEHESEKLKEALQKACRENNDKEQKRILEDIQRVKQNIRYYIYVEYLDMPADVNRVVKTERQLIISLSKKLLENARAKDGSFTEDGFKNLRQVTAHELGHAFLHSQDMKPGALQGSKELDKTAENEADIFAEELLELQRERHKAVNKSGAL